MRFALMKEPIAYQLTLHKERLDAYYKTRSTNFINELVKFQRNEPCDVHMHNICVTYGVDTVEHFLKQFFKSAV